MENVTDYVAKAVRWVEEAEREHFRDDFAAAASAAAMAQVYATLAARTQ